MAATSAARRLPPAAPATVPQIGCGAVAGGQQAFRFSDGKSIAEHIAMLYTALRETVDEHLGGPVAFAALLEAPIPDVSRRLRRVDDGKGNLQRAPLDYLGAVASDPVARWSFLERLCALWGAKEPELLRQPTAEEKLALVVAELPEKRRRQIEREHGLPAGSLDK